MTGTKYFQVIIFPSLKRGLGTRGLSYIFKINWLVQLKNAKKSELSYKKRCVFSLIGNYLRPSNNSRQLIFNINDVVFIVLFC